MAKKEEKKIEKEEVEETSSPSIIIMSENPVEGSRWYVVHTYSGHELKVASTLSQRVESIGKQDEVSRVLIPTQKKIVISEGKKRSVDERIFPGYILVQMKMSDQNWYIVRSTTGVTGFVGAGSRPTPLSEEEVEAILKFTRTAAPKFEAKFKEGDGVRVTSGIFTDYIGKVTEVNEDQGKVKVLVSVFGRETPVELDFMQVTPL